MFNPNVVIPINKKEVEDFLSLAFYRKLTHMFVAGWFLDKLNKNNLKGSITEEINNQLLVFLNKEIPFIELSTWVDLYNNARN
jgi:hypothetical protein